MQLLTGVGGGASRCAPTCPRTMYSYSVTVHDVTLSLHSFPLVNTWTICNCVVDFRLPNNERKKLSLFFFPSSNHSQFRSPLFLCSPKYEFLVLPKYEYFVLAGVLGLLPLLQSTTTVRIIRHSLV